MISRTTQLFREKKIYIPDNVAYKAPGSEKQFVSAFPASSNVLINRDSDLIFGVHWCNQQIEDNLGKSIDIRVDLDIHLQNLQESFGWDSDYRSDERDVLFSGDMTDADLFVLSLNNYTDTGIETPFEIVVAKAKQEMKQEEFENYMLDPDQIICTIPMKMDPNMNMMRLGFVKFENDRISFVFNSFNTISRIVSETQSEIFEDNMNYLESYLKTALDLKQLLIDSKADLCSKDSAEIDLSLDVIDKSTFINMFA